MFPHSSLHPSPTLSPVSLTGLLRGLLLSGLLLLGACAPGADPQASASEPSGPVVAGPAVAAPAPTAPVARIIGYDLRPASPRAFLFTRTLSESQGGSRGGLQGGFQGGLQGEPPDRGVIEVAVNFVSEHERYGYAGLLILAEAMNGGEPASRTAHDLPTLTTEAVGTVRRRVTLSVADPRGTFPTSQRIEISNRIDGIRLTIFGVRRQDAASWGRTPGSILADPLRHRDPLDVLDERLIAVDYRLTGIFEGSK